MIMEPYEQKISYVKKLLKNADCVLIGAGSGLSTAAGLVYTGARFKDNFSDFIKKYKMTDMYSSAFYPFKTQEEKWAYWSRHILLNRYDPPALPLYKQLCELVKDKDHFVITTNVDHQFYKAGFDERRIFAVQGDYGKFQCAKACHVKLYDNENAVNVMAAEQQDCKIPSVLIPKCPVCGGDMEVNIRKDHNFVEDGEWQEQSGRAREFIARAVCEKAVLLEFGVGFNTPSIIRFPFEQIVYKNENARLVRINKDHPEPIKENAAVTTSFSEGADKVIDSLLHQ